MYKSEIKVYLREEVVHIPGEEEFILRHKHIFVKSKGSKEFYHADTCLNPDLEISVSIANALQSWDGTKVDFSYEGYYESCETCGGGYIDVTVIDVEGEEIKVIDDGHLGGGTRGISAEEIIADWENIGYHVEIFDLGYGDFVHQGDIKVYE